MSTPFFHKVFWFLALYFHLKVYHIEALSFVSVVFSSRQENRKECLKFLRQDLKCLFEVKGGNQFLSYFLSVIVLIFSCMMLNKWFVTHVWVFLCNLLFFCHRMVSDVLLRFLLQVGRKPKNTKIRKRMSWILSSSWPTWPE